MSKKDSDVEGSEVRMCCLHTPPPGGRSVAKQVHGHVAAGRQLRIRRSAAGIQAPKCARCGQHAPPAPRHTALPEVC